MDMVNIITWFITLTTFLLGFFLGYKLHSAKNGEPFEIKLPKISFKKIRLGVVPKLTQSEILKKGTRYEASEKAMEETLDKEFNG